MLSAPKTFPIAWSLLHRLRGFLSFIRYRRCRIDKQSSALQSKLHQQLIHHCLYQRNSSCTCNECISRQNINSEKELKTFNKHSHLIGHLLSTNQTANNQTLKSPNFSYTKWFLLCGSCSMSRVLAKKWPSSISMNFYRWTNFTLNRKNFWVFFA